MTEILNNRGKLQGDCRDKILWSKDDAFAQVMGKERCGRVRGVSFGPTPTGRSGSNLLCWTGSLSSETAHRMTEFENSLRDQLAESEQRHQEQIASLHAWHKEEIAEALAEAKRESNAWHEQQMVEAKRVSDVWHEKQLADQKQQMDEMMSSVRAMLQEAMLQSSVSSLSNFSGTKNVDFNLMKLACLLQCIVMCY